MMHTYTFLLYDQTVTIVSCCLLLLSCLHLIEKGEIFLSFVTDGIHLIEVDRVLRPGGYFVWTSPIVNTPASVKKKDNLKRWDFVRNFAKDLCWDLLSQQDRTVVWKKPSNKDCYASR